MKSVFLNLTFFIVFISNAVYAQNAEISSGPMVGYTEHREVAIWIQTNCVKTITLKYWPTGTPKKNNVLSVSKNIEGCQTVNNHFVLTELLMGTTYFYEILIDGKPLKFNYPLTFKTKVLWEWRTDPPDFSFMLGSCFYVNDSAFDRPGKSYGQGTEILTKMNEKPTDFMLWLGDNTYTREADYSSASGIEYRYRHTRADKNLQPFLASRSHYAIWDDHDFGPNDGNKSYVLKTESQNIFKSYWANKSYGQNNKGIYGNFKFSDAEFFLLDDRFFRDDNELSEKVFKNKTQLGNEQINWLFNALLASAAKFKFIAIGGQFLNLYTDKESYIYFKKERKRIIQFITEHKIKGVVFLSGDRHHTELLKDKSVISKLGYELYELTCSPLTSGANNIAKTKEYNNPMRVDNTLVAENNFCTISINGPRDNRLVVIHCFDKYGALRWEKTLSQQVLGVELKIKKSDKK